MSKPTDKTPPKPAPDPDPSESTVEMPAITVVPDLTAPPDTIVMPAYKRPKSPHLGQDDADDEHPKKK